MTVPRSVSPFIIALMLAAFGLTGCSSDDPPAQSAAGPMPAPAAQEAPVERPAVATPADTKAVDSAPVAETSSSTEATAPEEDSAASTGPQQYVVKGVVTQWAPMVLFVEPGDQIVFKQMAGHDTETIDGMIPEGAETWKSKLGQEGFAVSPKVPGVYLYKCNPHVSLGMIGAIVVGDPPPGNLGAIEAHPQNKGMIGRAIRKLKQALEKQGNS